MPDQDRHMIEALGFDHVIQAEAILLQAGEGGK
jgi:hypothetical protein